VEEGDEYICFANQPGRNQNCQLYLRYFMKKKRILIILIVLIAVGFAVRFGLPAAMKGMGLHQEYVGQRYLLPEGRALIITTSHDRLGDDGDKTGVFGSELTAPYYEFQGWSHVGGCSQYQRPSNPDRSHVFQVVYQE
jgi:hypothetical protein